MAPISPSFGEGFILFIFCWSLWDINGLFAFLLATVIVSEQVVYCDGALLYCELSIHINGWEAMQMFHIAGIIASLYFSIKYSAFLFLV